MSDNVEVVHYVELDRVDRLEEQIGSFSFCAELEDFISCLLPTVIVSEFLCWNRLRAIEITCQFCSLGQDISYFLLRDILDLTFFIAKHNLVGLPVILDHIVPAPSALFIRVFCSFVGFSYLLELTRKVFG